MALIRVLFLEDLTMQVMIPIKKGDHLYPILVVSC
jgi:hypothetical protein